jgi:hypothetical protein
LRQSTVVPTVTRTSPPSVTESTGVPAAVVFVVVQSTVPEADRTLSTPFVPSDRVFPTPGVFVDHSTRPLPHSTRSPSRCRSSQYCPFGEWIEVPDGTVAEDAVIVVGVAPATDGPAGGGHEAATGRSGPSVDHRGVPRPVARS